MPNQPEYPLTKIAVDPKLLSEIDRRNADCRQTLAVLGNKIHLAPGAAYSRGMAEVQVQTRPQQVIELINELRGEVELLAEQYGHLFGHTV